jgi:alpha-glucosidase (family GH31 glycosyl hydrolase)
MQTNPNTLTHLQLAGRDVYFDYHGWHARLSASAAASALRLTVTAAPHWPLLPTISVDPTIEKHADETVASGGSGQRFEQAIVTDASTTSLTLDGNTLSYGNYNITVTADGLFINNQTQPVAHFALPQLTDTTWTGRVVGQTQSRFYGGGTQNGIVSLNDRLIEIKNENRWSLGGVSSPIPFFWSTDGYGILVNSFTQGEYDFSEPHRGVLLKHADPVCDLYLLLAPSPAGLIHAYQQLTGTPATVPDFTYYPAHLNAYNRDYWVPVTPESAGAVRFEDGQYYKEYQPVKKETFNTGYRPGAIHVQGQTLLPNVGGGSVTFTNANDEGQPSWAIHESLNGTHDYQFSARAVIDRYRRNGLPLGWILPNDGYGAGYGQTATLAGDLANLAEFTRYSNKQGIATALWTQQALHPHDAAHPQKGERDLPAEITAGIRGLKTDVAWVGEGYTFGLNATQKAAAELAAVNARPAIISLDGWAGSQRSAIIWTGDQSGSNWGNIKTHIASYLSTGLSGNPHVASDVDGIYAGSDPIIQTRDLQWKAFTPHLLAMDGWGSRAKWLGMDLPQRYLDINRDYLAYHSSLLPYFKALAAEASATGAPIMRPLWWHNDNDAYAQTTDCEDELLLGDAILLAPITAPYQLKKNGDGARAHLYLPAGKWFNFWTGELVDGGSSLANVPAPLTQSPLFIRAGSVLPRTTPHLTPAERSSARQFDWYPGASGALTLVDDDGSSLDWQHGEQTHCQLNWTHTTQRDELHIAATTGAYTAAPTEYPSSIFIAGVVDPAKITLTIAGLQQSVAALVSDRAAHPLTKYSTAKGIMLDLGHVSASAEIDVQLHH